MARFCRTSPVPAAWRIFTRGLLLCAWLACVATNAVPQADIAARPPELKEAGVPSFVVMGGSALGLSGEPVDVHPLPDGRILAFARNEFAVGDGARWEVFRQEENDTHVDTFHVMVSADGELFAGVANGISRIRLLDTGRWRFEPAASVSALTGNSPSPLNRVNAAGGEWYWWWGSGPIVAWHPGREPAVVGRGLSAERFFVLEGKTHFSESSTGGLQRLDDGQFRPIAPATDGFVDATITSQIVLGDKCYVGTLGRGLFRYSNGTFSPADASPLLAGAYPITDLQPLATGGFVAALDNFGIAVFSDIQTPTLVLPRTLDQRLSRPRRVFQTENGDIWALLASGLVRIAYPSRVTHFEPLVPTSLMYVEISRIKGRLWFMTDGKTQRGLYGNDGRLTGFEIDSPPGYANTLLEIEGHPVAATELGLFEHGEDDGWRAIEGVPPGANVMQKPIDGYWLFATENEIGRIRKRDGRFEIERIPSNGLGRVFRWERAADGRLWVELGAGRLAVIDVSHWPATHRVYDSKNGITDGWVQLFMFEGKPYVNLEARILELDTSGEKWIPASDLISRYHALAYPSGRPKVDALGRLWVAGRDGVTLLNPDGSADISMREIPRELNPIVFYTETDGVVWLHERKRLTRFDPTGQTPTRRIPTPLISRVISSASGRNVRILNGQLSPLRVGENALLVHFAAPGSALEHSTSFEFRLADKGEWISVGHVGTALLSQLQPGAYALEVRCRVDDSSGPSTSLSFVVATPWYRSAAATTIFILVGLVIVATFVLGPVWLEHRQKVRLEALVKLRTGELEESEEHIRALNAELESRVTQRTVELESANSQLQVANQELEAFSYSVSHDLRSPLRNITGFMQLLRKRLAGNVDRDSERHLDIVIGEATRLAGLIDDLLAFSRVNRAELNRAPVLLDRIAADVRDEIAHDLAGRRIDWSIDACPAVLGDAVLLRQALANLFANAVKFTRTREVARIALSAKPLPDSADWVLFSVKDNGVGFNPEYADKLFGVFQRLHSAKEFEGTGIGLANVKRIVLRHGGRIWAEGSVDCGVEFFFTLPRIHALSPHGPEHPPR